MISFEQRLPKFSYQGNKFTLFLFDVSVDTFFRMTECSGHKEIIKVTVPNSDGTGFVVKKLIIKVTTITNS